MLTRTYEIPSRTYEILTRTYEIPSRTYYLLSRTYEILSPIVTSPLKISEPNLVYGFPRTLGGPL